MRVNVLVRWQCVGRVGMRSRDGMSCIRKPLSPDCTHVVVFWNTNCSVVAAYVVCMSAVHTAGTCGMALLWYVPIPPLTVPPHHPSPVPPHHPSPVPPHHPSPIVERCTVFAPGAV